MQPQLTSIHMVPLNSKQIHDKLAVRNAYADFWSNIKFKKGWERPSITLTHEVDELLDTAAEIVVRIRSYLDSKHPSLKIRMLDGSAREHLWTIDGQSLANPIKFVSDIVHATFKDANGYVEGLTEEQINSFINQFYEYKKKLEVPAFPTGLIRQIKESWLASQREMNKLMELEIFNVPEEEPSVKVDKQQVNLLQSIQRELDKLVYHAQELAQYKPVESSTEQPSPTSTQPQNPPAPEPMKVEEVTEQDSPSVPQKEDANQTDNMVEEGSQLIENTNSGESTTVDPKMDEDCPKEVKPSENSNDPAPVPANDTALLKIKTVAEGVDTLKENIKSIHESAAKLESLESGDMTNLKDARKTVEDLQKKCISYTETLLKDLMALDEIVNTPEARPLRKQQVQSIQQLMSDVDGIKMKLRNLLKIISEREDEEAKQKAEAKMEEEKQTSTMSKNEIQEEKEEIAQPKNQTALQNKRMALQSSQHQDLTEMWKRMKLKPKMDVSDTRDGYVVTSFIPGMKKEDIDIALSANKRTLTISGVRLPSPEELAQLKLAVQNKIRSAPFLHPDEELSSMILRAGAGRYGRFEETYELPNNADTDNIEASYERGIMKVMIPKKRTKPTSSYYGRTPHPATFYNDRDFWW